MPKTQMDYSRTIIYKICCKDVSITDIYIGHTTNFIQRNQGHRLCCRNINSNNYNQYVYEFIRNNGGWENWYMIQIEEYNCNNRREAIMRERYWMDTLKATLNTNNPYTSPEEKQLYQKCWYDEKKDSILQKAKEHYEENKEQKLEYQKQYASENKEQIQNYQKEYREDNKEKISEQNKIYREENKEKIKVMLSKWCEDNKELIKAKRSQVINCDCGNQYAFGNKNRHLQTKIHVDFQNQLCGIIKEVEPIIVDEVSEEEKLQVLRQKQKEYREKNSEKIKVFKKKYNEEHKEENSQSSKKYYEMHKDKIIQQTKTYVNENKDKIKEQKNEWYQKNKEKVLERLQELYTCECGSEIRRGGKAEHNRSVKHKTYIECNQINNIVINV